MSAHSLSYIGEGGGFADTIEEIWLLNHVTLGSGVWDRLIFTDKGAPTLSPATLVVSNTNGTLLRNNAVISWTEASGHSIYNLRIFYHDRTDPTKDTSVLLAPGRSSPYTGFLNAGDDGDTVYATAQYETLEIPPLWIGPSITAADHVMT